MSRIAVTVVTTSFVVGSIMLACGGESAAPVGPTDPDASSSSSGSTGSSGTSGSSGTDASSGGLDGSSGGTDGGDASAPATREDKYARAFCEALDKCGAVLVKIGFGDAATCAARVKAKAALDLKAPGVTVTDAQLDACIAKIKTLDCSSPAGIAECEFTGSLANDAPCDIDAQCQSGACFKAPSLDGGVQVADCGTCKPKAAADADCSAAKCGNGYRCVPGNGGPTCVKLGAVTEACSASAPCGGNLSCVGNVCTKPLALGAACTNALGVAPCDTAAGHYCKALPNQSGLCTAVGYATPPNLCGISIAALTVTQCSNSSCSSQIPAGTCVPYAGAGEACGGQGGKSCASPLECKAGKCELVDPARCK
jgi:hypothetical protein